ncbi:MAG: alpha/beta fold hydrolase [Deltaproteobacteria bacterium]
MPGGRRLLTRLLVAMIALVALRAALRSVARRYLFPAREVATARGDLRGVERLALVARDGVPVRALLLPPPPGGPVVVGFHNNRSTAEDQLPTARALVSRGLGVALVEYRGYGRDAGRDDPTEDGLFADGEAVLAHLRARGIGPGRVVLWGTSLGTGVAAEMARRGLGRALVLITPYTSIPDLVTAVVPFAPAGQIIADCFDTLARSGAIRVPTLVIHGDRDEVVPFWMGERVARAIDGARLVRVPGGHHGDLFARAGDRLLAEMSALVALRPGPAR